MATSSFEKLDLFNNPEFSDGILKIVTRQNEISKGRGKKKQRVDSAKGLSYHISSCVLALHSEFFRGKVQTSVGNASTETCKTFELLVESGEEEIAEELIKYMYSEEIGLTRGEDVAKLMTLAHQFLVQSCETKCLQLLVEGKLTIDIAASLCRSHEEAPFMRKVLDNVKTPLLEEFGDLEVVWTTQDLRDKFLRLPLTLVEVLFASPELRVASENSVFTAGYLWMEHNEYFQAGERGAHDAWQRIVEPMRFWRMSIFFLVDVVSHLEPHDLRIKPSVVEKAITGRLFSTLPSGETEAEKAERIQRPSSLLTVCSVEWKVSATDIDGMYDKKGDLSSTAQSWCGYKLSLCLFWDDDGDICVGALFVETAVPIEEHHLATVELTADIKVKSSLGAQGRILKKLNVAGSQYQKGECFGRLLLKKSLVAEGSRASEVLSGMGLLHDGYLHITGSIHMHMGPM